jgi:glutathione S-transferase
MDQIMGICDWYLFQGVANVIAFQRIVGPRLMRLTPDETAIAGSMPKARVVFAELSRLLGEKPYVASSELTLADLMIAPHLDFLAQTPEWTVLTEPHPNLVIWLERVTGRRSLQATTWERVVEMAGAA